MTDHRKPEGWQCTCGNNVKGVHSYCGGCGNSWERAQRGLYAPKKQRRQPWTQQDWTTNQWDWDNWDGNWTPRSSRSNSPRTPRDQPKPKHNPKNPKSKGKGKNKEKNPQPNLPKGGKGAGKGKEKDPEPPWKPPKPTVPATSSTTGAAATSAAEQDLRSLIGELAKTEGLSNEAQRIIKEHGMKTAQTEAKAMHMAVTKLGAAKKQYQTVLLSQHTFFQEWSKYLALTSDRWKKYSEEFCIHDTQLKEDLTTALKNIKLARSELRALQDSESGSKTEVTGETAVDDISDEDLERPDRSAVLAEGMQGMVHNFDTMHRQAEETLRSLEPVNKKAKLAEGVMAPSADALMQSSPSLVPFHKPGS